MTTTRTYKLEIHIDSQQITKESLEEKANAILRNYLTKGSISLQINTPHDFYYQLVVNGDLQSVDACHHKIDEDIIKKEDLKFYRYTDEAGDEIRYRVYPILADIEQRFRAFINKALAEILGFDWWENSVPEKINKVTSDRYSNSRKDQIAPHYLECTLFDDLIKLITINYCEFQDNLSFTNKEFDQLLQDCHSFDDLKLKWNQKKKVLSYWEIFSKYFDDRKQWDDDLKKELENFVINVRNKVMHHRPIRFCVIKKLDEIKEELIKVFDSAKSELSEEEIIEAKQEIQEMESTLENIRKMMTIHPSATENIRKMMTVQPSTAENIRKMMTIQPSAMENLRNMIYQPKKSIYPWIETEEFFEDEIESDLLDEEIEKNNEFDDINSNGDNMIADENELDQNS